MPLPRLEIVPDQTGYSVEEPSDTVRIATAGGSSANYRDMIGASSLVSITWICDPDEYEELVEFYKVTLKKGALPFLIDLVIDEPFPSEYEATFIPNTFTLSSVKGLTYTVTAQLEAAYQEPNEVYDNFIVDQYGGNEEETTFVNLLERLVNVLLPGAVT